MAEYDPDLLRKPPQVINIGPEWFAAALARQDVPVAQVTWSPPARGDAELMDILDDLL